MHLVFVVQTHTAPQQIAKLLAALNQGVPDRTIIVSHDGDLEELQEIAAEHQVDKLMRGHGGRGRFGLLESYLDALRWLRENGRAYDWVVHLSGQDYPVAPLVQFSDVLATSAYDGYFYHFLAFDEADKCGPMVWSRTEAENRYLFQYDLLSANAGLVVRALTRLPRLILDQTRSTRLSSSYGLVIGRRAEQTPFSQEFRCYGGSYWQIIRKRCVDYLLDFTDSQPAIVDYFRRVLNPDEAMLQSILLNSARFNISKNELRYYDFDNSHLGHPRVLTRNKIVQVAQSGFYFARKIDIGKDPQILDWIDETVLRQNVALIFSGWGVAASIPTSWLA